MIFFADLHVHIGRASQGEPVKITASPKLTLQGILAECLKRKGIQIAGIVDAASPPVIRDIQELMAQDKLVNLPGGGLSYLGQVTLFLGAEVELAGPNGGSAHFLAYSFDRYIHLGPSIYQLTHTKKKHHCPKKSLC